MKGKSASAISKLQKVAGQVRDEGLNLLGLWWQKKFQSKNLSEGKTYVRNNFKIWSIQGKGQNAFEGLVFDTRFEKLAEQLWWMVTGDRAFIPQ